MKHNKSKLLQFKNFEAFYRRHEVIKVLYTAMTREEAWAFKHYVYSIKIDNEYLDAIWKYLNEDITLSGLSTFYSRSKNLRKKEKLGIAK